MSTLEGTLLPPEDNKQREERLAPGDAFAALCSSCTHRAKGTLLSFCVCKHANNRSGISAGGCAMAACPLIAEYWVAKQGSSG